MHYKVKNVKVFQDLIEGNIIKHKTVSILIIILNFKKVELSMFH
jgi:hypothetical protein